MERCKESAIVAERFKASSKKINQTLVDVIVSVKTGCRAYQVEQPVIRKQAGPSKWRRNNKTRTVMAMTNVINEDGATISLYPNTE